MSTVNSINSIASLVAPFGNTAAAAAAASPAAPQASSAAPRQPVVPTLSLRTRQNAAAGLHEWCRANRILGQKRHRRHRKVLKDSVLGVTRPNIQKLARRAGVKDVSADVYDTTRAVVKERIEEVMEKLIILCRSADRKNVVTASDVAYVLKQMGQPSYGFGDGRVRAPKDFR